MRTRFVLVRPRNPNNIGAAARAMANFGLSDLALADPHPPVWREARSAVGAEALLKKARALPLEEALKGADLVLGTSDGRRRLRQTVVPLTGLGAYLAAELPKGGRLAVLFGSEKNGLTNRELQHCRALVRIPTAAKTPSMNLGQAAALLAYELSRPAAPVSAREPGLELPGVEQREDLVRRFVGAMDALGYARNTPEAVKAERVRRMLLRWDLARPDAALLQSLFRRVSAAR